VVRGGSLPPPATGQPPPSPVPAIASGSAPAAPAPSDPANPPRPPDHTPSLLEKHATGPVQRLAPPEVTTPQGIKFKATPGKTTTIIGCWDQDIKHVVLNELKEPKSTDFGPKPGGYNVLNVPDEIYKEDPRGFWENVNKPWLDKAIDRGDNIYQATPPNRSLYYDGKGNLTGYGNEMLHLKKRGYIYDPATKMMVRKIP